MCWIIHQIIFRLFCLCCLQDDFSSHCFIWRLFNNSEISYINPDSWILKCRHYYYELISDLIKQPMFGLQQRTDWICLLGKGSEWAGSNLFFSAGGSLRERHRRLLQVHVRSAVRRREFSPIGRIRVHIKHRRGETSHSDSCCDITVSSRSGSGSGSGLGRGRGWVKAHNLCFPCNMQTAVTESLSVFMNIR